MPQLLGCPADIYSFTGNHISDNYPSDRLSDNHTFNHPTGYNPYIINTSVRNHQCWLEIKQHIIKKHMDMLI